MIKEAIILAGGFGTRLRVLALITLMLFFVNSCSSEKKSDNPEISKAKAIVDQFYSEVKLKKYNEVSALFDEINTSKMANSQIVKLDSLYGNYKSYTISYSSFENRKGNGKEQIPGYYLICNAQYEREKVRQHFFIERKNDSLKITWFAIH